jgi:hypothetical protein
MKKLLILFCGITIAFYSCDLINTNSPLSDSDVIDGLKTALNVGADTASGNLAKVNGYYNDPLVKIPLPSEAETVRNLINGNSTLAAISATIGLDAQFENVIKTVNRAAENAASEAAPIFGNAITNLSISDGLTILQGTVPSGSSTKSASFDSTAATEYLKQQTYTDLTALYAPQINTALGQDLIGGVSATEAWSSLTSAYNSFVSRSDVQIAIYIAGINLPSSIDTDLGEFSTQKALDGLFYKVGLEEKQIRKNPLEWATTAVGDILEKVFGTVN